MICVVCNLRGHRKVLERGVSEDYARGCNDWSICSVVPKCWYQSDAEAKEITGEPKCDVGMEC